MSEGIAGSQNTSAAPPNYESSILNTAALAYDWTMAHDRALEAGWVALVQHPEWREWLDEHLYPADPFLYLAIRDDRDRRLLLKTKFGVSAHVPIEEVLAAEESGELVQFFAALIRAIYAKWASIADCPAPPAVPKHPRGGPARLTALP